MSDNDKKSNSFCQISFAGRFSLLQYRSWSSPSSGPADVNGRNGRIGQLIRNIQSGKTSPRYNPDKTVNLTSMKDWKIEKTKGYIKSQIMNLPIFFNFFYFSGLLPTSPPDRSCCSCCSCRGCRSCSCQRKQPKPRFSRTKRNAEQI